jgi:hypothetical protein
VRLSDADPPSCSRCVFRVARGCPQLDEKLTRVADGAPASMRTGSGASSGFVALGWLRNSDHAEDAEEKSEDAENRSKEISRRDAETQRKKSGMARISPDALFSSASLRLCVSPVVEMPVAYETGWETPRGPSASSLFSSASSA